MTEMVVRGKKAVAEHFGVSVRTVQNWEKAGMPTLGRGYYDLVAIGVWRDQKKGIVPQGRPPESKGDPRQPSLPEERGKDFWDKEGKKHQAKLRELEYLALKKKLMPTADYDEGQIRLSMIYRQDYQSFYPEMMAILPPALRRDLAPKIQKLIRDRIERMRQAVEAVLAKKAGVAKGGVSHSTFVD
jgi:hypothetical protein